MVLVQKVLDILNSIEDIQTVIYDSGFSANVRIDRKPMPMALFYLLNDWSIDLSKSTAIKEAANIQIFFADKADLDAKGEDKDIIVMRMELIAREFIRRILEDRSIVVVDDKIKLQSSYGKFDKFVVGVSVSFKIEERQSSCL